MANSFTFNSLDFSTYGLTVLKPFFPFFSFANVRAVNLTIGDGSVSPPTKYSSRIFSVPCVVKGTSFTDLKDKMDSIALGLSQREEQQIIFDIINDRYWLVKPLGLPDLEVLGSSVAGLDIDFVATDPHAYDITENTEDTGTLPDAITFNVGGTIEAYPVITIVCTGACSSFTVENEALNMRLEWVAPSGMELASTDEVQINCNPTFQTFATKLVTSGEDSFTVRLEGVNGVFPQLSPGASNTLSFTTIIGTFTIVWNDRYQ